MSVQEVPRVKICVRCGKEYKKKPNCPLHRWERSKFCSQECSWTHSRADGPKGARKGSHHKDQEIPIELIRDAVYNDSKLSLTDISHALGWGRTWRDSAGQTGDSSRLRRALGMRASHFVDGEPVYKTHMTYKDAGNILRAANLYPVDYDI